MLPPAPFVVARALPSLANTVATTLGPMTDVAVVSSSDLLRLRVLLTATGPAMELRSPITGDVIGELPTSTPADVEVGAQLAHRAQAEWAARPIAERARLLLDFHDHLLDQRDYFIDLLQSVGKDRLSAANEVFHVASLRVITGVPHAVMCTLSGAKGSCRC